MPDPNIKSMGLYRNVERVLADLEHAGLIGDVPLRVDDLVPYDQYHYEGTNAVDAAAEQLAVKPDDHVLDVGSGLGGPARYLADRTGCRVAALELQPDLHTIAEGLTARCGLDGRVEHLVGDILAGAAGAGRFDGLMSMLCFLHISDRPKLFDSCREALRPGARMYIEDYFAEEIWSRPSGSSCRSTSSATTYPISRHTSPTCSPPGSRSRGRST